MPTDVDAEVEQARIEEATNRVAELFLADLRRWHPGVTWTRVSRHAGFDRVEGTVTPVTALPGSPA